MDGEFVSQILQYLSELRATFGETSLQGATRDTLGFGGFVKRYAAGGQQSNEGTAQILQYLLPAIRRKQVLSGLSNTASPISIKLDEGIIQAFSLKVQAADRLIKFQVGAEQALYKCGICRFWIGEVGLQWKDRFYTQRVHDLGGDRQHFIGLVAPAGMGLPERDPVKADSLSVSSNFYFTEITGKAKYTGHQV